jgi:hypothetical protein
VRSVAPAPQGVGAVYIGVEEGGIYRSADRGETWESLNWQVSCRRYRRWPWCEEWAWGSRQWVVQDLGRGE